MAQPLILPKCFKFNVFNWFPQIYKLGGRFILQVRELSKENCKRDMGNMIIIIIIRDLGKRRSGETLFVASLVNFSQELLYFCKE